MSSETTDSGHFHPDDLLTAASDIKSPSTLHNLIKKKPTKKRAFLFFRYQQAYESATESSDVTDGISSRAAAASARRSNADSSLVF